MEERIEFCEKKRTFVPKSVSMELTDNEILEGLKQRDGQVTQTYFYGYCRVAYCIYDRRYGLQGKPGLDFYSLAHEYYLSLDKHGFRQLEDRHPDVSLKTWMVNGFRFVLLDKLKAVELEHRTESLEQRVGRCVLRFDIADNNYKKEVREMVFEICHSMLRRDSVSSLILQMMLVDGFKGKEVAAQLGLTPSAVSQRYTRLMRNVVMPFFKRNYEEEPIAEVCYEASPQECLSAPSGVIASAPCPPTRITLHKELSVMDYTNRITPNHISHLADGEIFVFGSNLAGMHGGGAARAARLYFGAKIGQGVGLQGQSYAIPTMQGGPETIQPYVDEFVDFARQHPDMRFLVTRIGCGIAGFTPEDIAPLFRNAVSVGNICLPDDFWALLNLSNYS